MSDPTNPFQRRSELADHFAAERQSAYPDYVHELAEAEANLGRLAHATRATLQFYDNLGRDHDPGETKVLDDLAAALAKAERS